MSKGTRRERQAVELLQKTGYATYRPATVMYGENDVFGLFDVMAIAPDLPTRAIQVKSNRASGVIGWMHHTQLFRRIGFKTEFWVCHDTKGWRVFQAAESPYCVPYDGRERDDAMGAPLVQWLQEGQR